MLKFKLLFLLLVYALCSDSQPKLVSLNESYAMEEGLNWTPDGAGNILSFKANNLYKAQKGQLPKFAKSIIFKAPVSVIFDKDRGSSICLTKIFIQGGHSNNPFPFEYAWERISVIPYSE